MAVLNQFNLKPGVDPTGVTAELLAALGIAQSVYSQFGQPFTITSLSEGQHVTNSKHYIGQAADLRTNGVDPATVPQIASSLQSQLGSDYLVLNEGDHIHVQYNGVGTATGAGTDSLELPDLTGLFTDSAAVDGTVEAGQVDYTMLAVLGLAGLGLWLWFRD